MKDNFLIIFVTPIVVFILSFLFKNRKGNGVDDSIKVKENEIEEVKKDVEKQKEQVKESKKDVIGKVEEIEKVKEENITKKEDRDEKAKKFFPNL